MDRWYAFNRRRRQSGAVRLVRTRRSFRFVEKEGRKEGNTSCVSSEWIDWIVGLDWVRTATNQPWGCVDRKTTTMEAEEEEDDRWR